MNNEPVAWMNEYEQICHATDKKMEEITNNIGSPRNYFNYTIPLYTHPAKELTQNITGVWRLSDQSIQIVFTSCRSASEFVEILRKAQE